MMEVATLDKEMAEEKVHIKLRFILFQFKTKRDRKLKENASKQTVPSPSVVRFIINSFFLKIGRKFTTRARASEPKIKKLTLDLELLKAKMSDKGGESIGSSLEMKQLLCE